MKKLIAFVLVMIMALSLVACADAKNLTDSLSDIYSAAIASTDMDEDTKSHYNLAEMYSIEFNADSENLGGYLGNNNYEYSFEFKEGLCVMYSFGGGFQLVLIRLNSTANADEIENELKTNFDKNKWVCMSAEAVETARIGDVIILVAGGTETVQQIIDGFNTAYSS
ncbi:MAG TPA: hypothetical protein PK675_00815 [Clostridia bacterium]|nr:hypothetical protein [Clostridia bacterium]